MRVVEPARSQLGSRVRYYLYAFLAFCLGAEVVADLQSGGFGHLCFVMCLAMRSVADLRTGRGRRGWPRPAACL